METVSLDSMVYKITVSGPVSLSAPLSDDRCIIVGAERNEGPLGIDIH